MGGSTSAPSEAATTIGGRYRLLTVVGSGGMGRVWLATDELLGRRVAVKEIATAPDLSESDGLAAQLRTMREARTAARLDHPNVVGVFDVVWSPGRSWIVMEYVSSRSLHDIVAQDGPLSHRDAAKVGLGVLAALRAAHAAGVLHRDVKPHNVLVADDGRVVLGDFGLATFAGDEGTRAGAEPIMGSPHFVAPERVSIGAPVGEPADLWSLGATLYCVVEGRPPFARSGTTESLAALVTDLPDPPTRPGPLDPVIAALLVKDPARRMDARQAEEALHRIADRAIGVFAVPAARRPVGLARMKPAVPAQAPALAPPAPVAPKPRSRTTRIAVGAASLTLIGAVGAALVLASSRSTQTAGRAPVVAPATVPAVLVAQTCGGTPTDPEPVVARKGTTASGGWVSHLDPEGFRVSVPQTWVRSVDGTAVCFHDPDGSRTFSVDSEAPVTRRPLPVWQAEEKTVLDDGTLPGYERVAMGVVLLQKGGADWEYTWQPAADQRQHVRRLLLATGTREAYVLRWSTPDRDWPINEPHQRRIVDSFRDMR
jgi:hypothetical protein